jgi:hypothetical protein
VADEQLHRVLVDIYHGAENKLATLTPETREWFDNRSIMAGVIRWLPKCGDIPVKDFLLDCAASKEKDSSIRSGAVRSYLRLADAEEAKNVLLRFLVGEDRMDDHARSSIYRYPRAVWDTAAPEKKAYMVNALREAAAVESPQWVFEECDSQLIAMYPAYRDSLQREAMLRRQLSLPFSQYYTELKDKMGKEVKRLEKMKSRSNVSTNGITLTAQDFSIPQAEPLTGKNGAKRVPASEPDEPKPPAAPPPPPLRPAVPLAVGAGLLALFALWRGLRQRT